MQDLPDGVVTFLFTDVEGSTRLWEESPESMMEALRLHDDAIAAAVEAHNGVVVKPRGEGDSQFVVFGSAYDAVEGSAEIQRRLEVVDWPVPRPLRVRASLHTGLADLELGDYYGSTVNRAARLRAIAHGGQTVLSGSTFAVVQDRLPEGLTVTDMGLHRLKDLARPEHVFELEIEDLPRSFPPLRSLDAVPNNLPVQLTDFVGRRRELEDAKRTMGEARLLTILAPGGAGKTRLAIQVAAEFANEFADGVFFVALAPISSSSDIVQAVAESLGIALSTDEDPPSQLLAYLANKTQLLVFDNFEHLADGVGIVTEILKHAPDVKVIATSRSRLKISGETVMTLHGLDTSWETAEGALRTSGVRLFVHAAKRADASFSLSDDDLDPLGEILEQVGGMPLGIELAAAWVYALQVSEIATEIGKSLDFLESEAGDVPDRHRSIRAVFDYSWTMLTEDERSSFSALSLFRGGFTREAAEAVSGASMRNLANLVSRSLLVHDRDLGRYTVHELLRQYAADALSEDATRSQTVRGAHASFYANVAAHAEELIPTRDQPEALRIVEDDLDNIRAAWRYSLATGDAVAVRQFIIGLWILHEIRGWHQSAVELFGEALDALDERSEDDNTQLARSLASAAQAWFVAFLGQPGAAVDQAGEAITTLALLPDRFAYVMAIQFRCSGLMYLTRLEEVRAVTTEAVDIAETLDDEWLAAELGGWLAFAEMYLGNIDAAIEKFDDVARVLSQHHDYRARPWNEIGLAVIAAMQGRHGDAIRILETVVENAKEIGYRRAVQVATQQLGEARFNAGVLGAAEAAYLESLAMSEEMGSVTEMAEMLVRVAKVKVAMGRKDDAVPILACVLADPASGHSTMLSATSSGQMATDLLAEIGVELDSEPYATPGNAPGVAVTAKELLATG